MAKYPFLEFTPSPLLRERISYMYADSKRGMVQREIAAKYGYKTRSHVSKLLSWYRQNILKEGGEK